MAKQHSGLSEIDRLNGQNYKVWRVRIEFLLEEEGLFEALMKQGVKPTMSTPPTGTEKAALETYTTWQKQVRRARIIILNSLSNDLIPLFVSISNAKELWDQIEQNYNATSSLRRRNLLMHFHRYRKKDEASMADHLRTMKAMMAELREAGHDMSDEVQVESVLTSLPDDWDHFVVQVQHNLSVTTFDSLKEHIEMEVDRREFMKTKSRPIAMTVSPGKAKAAKLKAKKAGRKTGDGKQKPVFPPHGGVKKKKRRGAKGKNKKCFACGKEGHFARDCTEQVVASPLSHFFVTTQALCTDSGPLWILDTGATRHIARDRSGFTGYQNLPTGTQVVYVGNGAAVETFGVGEYQLRLSSGSTLTLHDCLHVPGITWNLVSISVLVRTGFVFHFSETSVVFDNGIINGTGRLSNGLFVIDLVDLAYAVTSINAMRWHARLGHIGKDRMTRLAKLGLLGPLTRVDLSPCESCLMSKAIRKPFGKAKRAEAILDLIHSDICGPFATKARHGGSYFLTFIDDYSRYGHVFLISHKSDALDCFRRYVLEVEKQTGKAVKVLRTDRGREYLSTQFKTLCEEKGIRRQLTTPHTPQQNGVAERRNRTLLEMVRAMMAPANLGLHFWGDALLTAVYVLNRVPSKSVPDTPYELWTGRKPSLEHLRPWGSIGYVRIPSLQVGKLDPRGRRGFFLRYPEHSKGYVMGCERPGGGLEEIESRDVTFLEEEFSRRTSIVEESQLYELDLYEPSGSTASGGGDFIPLAGVYRSSTPPMVANEPVNVQDGQDDPQSSGSLPQASGSRPQEEHTILEEQEPVTALDSPTQDLHVRRSSRIPIPRRRFRIEDEALVCTLGDPDEPRNISEALSSDKAAEWKIALEEEISSMDKNHVWDLVDLPPGRKTVGNKWVLKVKRKADGSIEKYKARLVAKGFTQQEGVDYSDTFSPVVRITSIRVILAMVAHMDLELYQMDVKTAFLNGELDEEIYMDQPEGFEVQGWERRVCRLKRSIYGLKQSSRQWYFRFHKAILEIGFEMIEEDHCVYIKRSDSGLLVLSLYVDDILIAGNDREGIVTTKKWLSSQFEMKDMGEASYILGIKIFRDRSKRFLGMSQETYIKRVLERYRMQDAKPIDTPIEKGSSLTQEMCPESLEDKKKMSSVPYASAVGSLMYAMLCTRPDICYAVSLVSRFQSNPGEQHWKAVKRIMRYLRGTADLMLCFHKGELRLRGYSDADWGADLGERRSTSAYIFIVAGGAVSWCSKKQTCVALSTMEAEYIACSMAVQEAVWLRRFFKRLLSTSGSKRPVIVHSDSMSALQFVKNPKYHGKAKHIQIRYHYIRDVVEKATKVVLEHISTNDMVADPLTKPIVRAAFQRHVSSMGLRRL